MTPLFTCAGDNSTACSVPDQSKSAATSSLSRVQIPGTLAWHSSQTEAHTFDREQERMRQDKVTWFFMLVQLALPNGK